MDEEEIKEILREMLVKKGVSVDYRDELVRRGYLARGERNPKQSLSGLIRHYQLTQKALDLLASDP